MKNKILSLIIMTISSISISFANEDYGSGQVSFIAKVLETSCKVTVNDQNDSNIYLGAVPLNEVYNSGPAAYLKSKAFTITLSECSLIETAKKEPMISVYWSGGNLATDANTESLGYLINALPDGAQNIAFALSINDDNTISQLNKIIPSSLNQLKTKGVVTENNKIIYTYYIGYVTQNPKQVTTGPLFSFATYDIEYN